MGRLLLSLSVAVVLNGCWLDGPVAPPAGDLSNGEYVVLAAIADSTFSRARDTIFVVETTDGYLKEGIPETLEGELQYLRDNLTGMAEETLANFRMANRVPVRIQSLQRIDPRCIPYSENSRAYPIVGVSRVGFGLLGTQALAYAGMTYAPLAGAGVFYLLSLEHGRWKIVGSVIVWIS